MADNTRYRVVDFIGGRILEAREMIALQNITEGVDVNGTPVVHDLNALYREGASLNITPVITAGARTVTVTPTDNTKPMQVFVRGRWETLRSADAPPVTLAVDQSNLYLNWALNVITSADDASLVDASTGEATANMGELDFTVSATDTSATSLGASQLAKNTAPIILFSFATAGTSLTLTPIDNALAAALGTQTKAGLVKISTATGAGVAVATDDPRLVNARPPADGSVVNISVRTPVSNGQTNSDGSAQYDLLADAGGISADKIIWQTYKERISDFLAWVRSQISSLSTSLTGHIGTVLGQSNTHPMPTASQVGAAPLSHVNLPLGTVGSHPATVNSDSGGFVVNESNQNYPNNACFQLTLNGSQIAAIQHNGDFASNFLGSLVFNPGGNGVTFSGSLHTLFQLAQIVRDHVNQNSHANPHGLTASDIGAVSNSSFSNQLQESGYFTLPGGLMVQWVTGAYNSSIYSGRLNRINFARAFPNACLFTLVSTMTQGSDYGEEAMFTITSKDSSGVYLFNVHNSDHPNNPIAPAVLAIGY